MTPSVGAAPEETNPVFVRSLTRRQIHQLFYNISKGAIPLTYFCGDSLSPWPVASSCVFSPAHCSSGNRRIGLCVVCCGMERRKKSCGWSRRRFVAGPPQRQRGRARYWKMSPRGRGQAAFVLLRAQKPCLCSIFLRHPFPRARVLSPPTRKKDLFFLRRRIFSRMGFPGNPVVEEMRSPPPPGRGGVTKRMDALHGCGGKKEVGINSWRSVGHENRSPHRHFLAPPPHVTHEKKNRSWERPSKFCLRRRRREKSWAIYPVERPFVLMHSRPMPSE